MIIENRKITPSKYQSAIYDEILNTNRNIVVRATAGSGKTTTIVESTKLIPHGKEAIFTAFNKSIAEELSKRLPSHILCSTIHSIGMRALLTHYRTKLMVNEYKSFNFLKEVSSNDTLPEELKKSPEEFAEYQYRMRAAVDLVRMTLTDIQPGPIMEICNHYGVDILEYEIEDVINVIKKYDLYNRGLCRRSNAIDYVDMIYVPILNPKIKLPQFDFVFIDEAQDLNRCQQEFIERLKKPNGRTIIVGDPRQSIYSFMGSDPQSFENFLRKPNTIELPLSTCYRCGTEIVKLAKSVYPEIEPFENNPPGEIRYGELEEADEGDFILSRNNRPLVYVYFELLEKGKNPIIVGKDIQEGLEALVNKVIKKNVDEGMAILQERLEQLKAELKEKGVKNIKANPRYEALNDKVLTISIITNRFETMKEVKEEITKMFENKENCIILTTIHKSKGLEADRVFMIERFDGMRLLPSPYAITEWQRVQEQNLKFVAFTRSRKSLIFIPNINSK